MKLTTKISHYYLLTVCTMFVIFGFFLYHLIRYEIIDDIDDQLYLRKAEISGNIPEIIAMANIGSRLHVSPVDKVKTGKTQIIDTAIFNDIEGEYVPFRQLTFYETIGHTSYKIVLRQSLLESEDLANSIILVLVIVFAFFAGFTIFLNLIITRRVFLPFFSTINTLRDYEVKSNKKLSLPYSDVDEFNLLNLSIEGMSRRIYDDFRNIKEFTENASHELQTPLAITISKLESLLDSNKLKQEQVELIQSALQSSNRLSRLNRGLLLLTRIEGGKYTERQNVDIRNEIESQIHQCQELLDMKGITVKRNLDHDLHIRMNPSLAVVLISTLVNNAVVHNIKKGMIAVQTLEKGIVIENSGNPLIIDPDQLFERFKKVNQTSGSMGLGLAIAKKICDLSDFQIKYENIESIHRISISF